MGYNIIKFSAAWCGQCQALDINMRKAGIDFKTIDVDKDYMIAEEYNVRNLPTIIVTDGNGNEVDRFTGVMTANKLKERLKDYD